MSGVGAGPRQEDDPAYVALIDSARFPPGVSVNISNETPSQLQVNIRIDAFYASTDVNVVTTNGGRIKIISPTEYCNFVGLEITDLLEFLSMEKLGKKPNHKKVPVCNGDDPQSVLKTVGDVLAAGGTFESMWRFGARYVVFKLNDTPHFFTLTNIA